MSSIHLSSSQINKKTFSEIHPHVEKVFSHINKSFSRQEINDLAWEVGFNKRISSRLSGYDFLLTMLMVNLNPTHASLQKMCDNLLKIRTGFKIAPQSLKERINRVEAAEFLEQTMHKVLKDKIESMFDCTDLLNHFSKILIQDSTTVELNEKLQEHFKGSGGRASKSFAKFDVIYDFKNKSFAQIKLTDQKMSDAKLANEIISFLTEDTLVIRDLGYFNAEIFKTIENAKAYFLSRLRSDILIYLNNEDEEPVDICRYVNTKCQHLSVVDINVFITKKKIPVRLLIERVPEQVANIRRRKANQNAKKHKHKPSKETFDKLDFTFLITNVPKEIWKSKSVFNIYKTRWLIELIFKNWKSQLNINYLKGIDPNRIRCLVFARLILVIIISRVHQLMEFIGEIVGKEISMWKVYEMMCDERLLLKIIKGTVSYLERRNVIIMASKSLCKDTRKRKTMFGRLREEESYS